MATKAADTAILSYISDALTNGSAFSDQLAQLSVPAPDVLISVSETGVPTVATLQGTFPEAARKALDAALRADMGGSWAQRAATFLRTQTGARSLTPREGSDPDAILSRAEAALTSGDLQTAMTEIAGLPKEAQEPMAEWLALAQKRLASTQAFAKLSAILDQ
ncbi:MAG: mitofilin family membrane protein [Cypionkella sp.]